MAQFKSGDLVKLKDEFYDEPDFKKQTRGFRKHIAEAKGIIYEHSGMGCSIPESLLELADMPKPRITGIWFDECTDSPAKKIEPKVGMYAKIIKPKYGERVGDIIRIEKVESPARIRYNTTPHSGIPYSRVSYVGSYELLPNYKPMRKWAESEIVEAKCIACDLFFSLEGKNFGYKFLDYYCRIHMNGREFTAKACSTDEPNINIGRMVVLCKATGRPLPDWIKKGAL